MLVVITSQARGPLPQPGDFVLTEPWVRRHRPSDGGELIGQPARFDPLGYAAGRRRQPRREMLVSCPGRKEPALVRTPREAQLGRYLHVDQAELSPDGENVPEDREEPGDRQPVTADQGDAQAPW